MKALILMILFLASNMFSQVTDIDGVLPSRDDNGQSVGRMLFYPDTTTSPWAWHTVFDASGVMGIKKPGNTEDSTFAVASSGTATIFPSVECSSFLVTNNTDGSTVYIGSSSNVTTSNGIPLDYGFSFEVSAANSNQYYHITSGTTVDLRCSTSK